MQLTKSTTLKIFCALALFLPVLLTGKEKLPAYQLEGMKKGLWKEIKEAPPTPQITSEKEVYRVDLAKFGIKTGLPAKQDEVIDGATVRCYPDAAYHQALANIKGINAAIAEGAESGAKWIVFPKAEIALCYSSRGERILINQSNIIVDFGGSTFKMIYDSEKRSPFHLQYDKKTKTYSPSTRPIHTLSGIAISVVDCKNTTVRNLKLIGDKIDRSFKLQAEKAMESTYGIGSGGNCENVVVEKIDASFFMGDGLTCSSSKSCKMVRVGYQMGWKVGNLSKKGEELEPEKGYFRSDFLKVAPGSTYYMRGYGYTQGMTALKKRAYHVYLYDADKKFISYAGFVPVLRFFPTTSKTAFVRLVVEEEVEPKDRWQMGLYNGRYGEKITLRDNYLHHNHRGGMTIGVNDMYITRNYFYNNGCAPDKEHNLPGFEQAGGNPFMTRYHINMEDSQGHNIRVVGNKFEGGRLGVAVRGTDFIVENNEFIGTGVTFYRMFHLICRNNTFKGGGIGTFPYNGDGGFVRNWYIDSNTINGNVSFSGNAPVAYFCNNTVNGRFHTAGKLGTFKGNTFLLDTDAGFTQAVQLVNIPRIENCKFIKSPDCQAKNTLLLNGAEVFNCIFERTKITVSNSSLRNSTLENCSLHFSGKLQLENCLLLRSDYKVLNNYPHHPHNSAFFIVPGKGGELVLDRCKIKVLDTKVPFFSSHGHSRTASVLTLKNTTCEPAGVLESKIFGGQK